MRLDTRPVLAPDVRGGVAGAVVDEENIDGHAASLGRKAAEHPADRRLLIARHDDRKTAMSTRRPTRRRRQHSRILHRHQRAPARGGRRGQPEQS